MKVSKDVSLKGSQVFAATVISIDYIVSVKLQSLEQKRLCADLVWEWGYKILFRIFIVDVQPAVMCKILLKSILKIQNKML